MLTARFRRLSVHYSVVRLMYPPNIHFGSLKDGVSAAEVFEVEVISVSEMRRSRFILAAWQLPDKNKKKAPPRSIFFTRFVKDGEEKKGGKCFMSLVFSCQKLGEGGGGGEGKRKPVRIY